MDCDWTALELAFWREKPQPSSGSMPPLGKGEVGSFKGCAFPAGCSLALPLAPALTEAPALSTFPPVLVTCLKVGSSCQPAPGQTPLPLLNFTHFVQTQQAGVYLAL